MKFELDLSRSRLLDAALVLTHAFAAVLIMTLPWGLVLKLALAIALILSLLIYLRRNRRRVRVEINDDNVCTLQIDEHPTQACRVSPQSFVASYFAVLILEADHASRKYITIAPDTLDADTFRRLRVFLRWGLRFAANPG